MPALLGEALPISLAIPQGVAVVPVTGGGTVVVVPPPTGGTGIYVQSGNRYNYAIGGLPFLSAATPDNPIVRESAPIRKQQFDASTTPGEQSLQGWWLRSQLSFHWGAGEIFADPRTPASSDIRRPVT
jgi:hypothetical protein